MAAAECPAAMSAIPARFGGSRYRRRPLVRPLKDSRRSPRNVPIEIGPVFSCVVAQSTPNWICFQFVKKMVTFDETQDWNENKLLHKLTEA